LAEEGCNVAICALDQEGIDKVVGEIKSKGVEAIGVVCDVMIPEDIDRTMKTLLDSWSTIHILVNNVGGEGVRVNAPTEEVPESIWLDTYNKNALTAIRFTIKVIPFMKNQKWGRVVTIVSLQGKEGGGRPWYNMSKRAEISLMKTLAMNKEMSKYGITFNSVAPGPIMFKNNKWDIFCRENPEEFKKMIDSKPIGRFGTPDEIASVVAFLCSTKASLVNGACIAADGGESKSF
jgi:3-oxoacyl-[acyl-carrier protein] reductase